MCGYVTVYEGLAWASLYSLVDVLIFCICWHLDLGISISLYQLEVACLSDLNTQCAFELHSVQLEIHYYVLRKPIGLLN